MSSGPRQDPLASLTGSSPLNPNRNGQNASSVMDSIKAIMASPQAQEVGSRAMPQSGQMQFNAPSGVTNNVSTALPGLFDSSQLRRPQDPGPGISAGNVAAGIGQQGMGQAGLAGMGAGDAASNAARASAASLPGASTAAADATAGMSQQMQEAMRQKVELAMKLMGA
jgi:hypothetical protein